VLRPAMVKVSMNGVGVQSSKKNGGG